MTKSDLFDDKPGASEYSAAFEKWWKRYPAHRRKEKVKCYEVWKKRGLDSRIDEVVSKLESDISFDPAWQSDSRGRQFIPLSKTYLNGGRYDDDKPRPDRAHAATSSPDYPEPPKLAWQERLMNRLGLAYMRSAQGLADKGEKLIRIKHEILNTEVPLLQEDIDVASDELLRKKAAGEVSTEIAKLFLSRLDQAYTLELRGRVMRQARR